MENLKITRNEKRFIQLLIDGFTDREIAVKMGYSYSTIRSICHILLIKSDAKNRPQLVSWAYKNKILK